MIIKANKRGGAKDLAQHLMSPANDHVEVLSVEGFLSDNLPDALQEIYAISRGTHCQKFMLSMSFNPPETATVSTEQIQDTVQRSMEKMGVDGQPFCLVAHEKEGRRHFHCVVSLIDATQMKAIKLPYYKMRLNDLAKDLYLENGWALPKGFQDKAQRDPTTFTLAEWQQAKRHDLDPREIRAKLQACWGQSDNAASFKHALKEAGYMLAQGDRRAFVAISWQGEIYSLSRLLGVKKKELIQRLGQPDSLPSVDETKAQMAKNTTQLHKRLLTAQVAQHRKERAPFKHQKARLIQKQRQARRDLHAVQHKRQKVESEARRAKFRPGWRGLWDMVTGKTRTQHAQNAADLNACTARDRQEKAALIAQHLTERQHIQVSYKALRSRHERERLALYAAFGTDANGAPDALKQRFAQAAMGPQANPQTNPQPTNRWELRL